MVAFFTLQVTEVKKSTQLMTSEVMESYLRKISMILAGGKWNIAKQEVISFLSTTTRSKITLFVDVILLLVYFRFIYFQFFSLCFLGVSLTSFAIILKKKKSCLEGTIIFSKFFYCLLVCFRTKKSLLSQPLACPRLTLS